MSIIEELQKASPVVEIDRIERLEIHKDAAFILTLASIMSAEAKLAVRRHWDQLFEAKGVTPPVLIILDAGLVLHRIAE